MVIDARGFLEGLFHRGDVAAAAPAEDVPVDWARAAAALLAEVADDDDRAGLRYEFEERAGVHEYDGGLPRDEAERLALEHLRRRLGEVRG